MSREVRRVPVGFDWPLRKVWDGYLVPDRLREPDCQACDGSGYSPGARVFADTFYPHMIPAHDRATQERLAWHDKIGQAEVDHLIAQGRRVAPTAAEVNAIQRNGGLGGHDAINRGLLVEFRSAQLGIDPLCSICRGRGTAEAYPGQHDEYEAWEPTDPPTGDAWQLWETTSEGSPISPVFTERDGLVEWLTSDAYHYGISRPLTREQAEAFTADGWAPTMVYTPSSGLVSGDAWAH